MSLQLPPGPLVGSAWLAQHLGDPRVRVVDVRGLVRPPSEPPPHYLAKRDAYRAGHIPGAVFVDWTRDIVDLDDPVPVQVAGAEQVARLFGSLGIGRDTLVVAYDDSFAAFASRLRWVLRSYGHDAVRVLDGGLIKWVAEGRPVTREVSFFTPAYFVPERRPELRRSAAQVHSALGGPTLLLDARNPAEYRGEASRAARGGHIPGAYNLYYRALLSGPHHTFASGEALRQRFRAAGVDLDRLGEREIVAYCNGGVSATVVALALEVASGVQAAIYDGSWNEWGNDESLPYAQGKGAALSRDR